jgi:hypothetical protein
VTLAPPFQDPDNRRPKSVQLTLENADPLGPSLRRLANSDAIVLTFPRDALRRACAWPEVSRRGVYMLIAPDTGDRALRIYIGQAQNVLTRLKKHERDRQYPRYLQIIVIVSTDDQLRDDIAKYVEQRIVQALMLTQMVEVENRSPRFPLLRPEDRLVAEQFFRDAMLLVGPVEPMAAMVAATITAHERRHSLLKEDTPRPVEPLQGNIIYELRRDHCHAFAVRSAGRNMRVLAGAKIAREIHYSLPRRGRELRDRLIAAGTLVAGPQDGALILLRDVDVFSQTGAADLVTGRKTDGYHAWKLANLDLRAPSNG